jgi:hypothetical protein
MMLRRFGLLAGLLLTLSAGFVAVSGVPAEAAAAASSGGAAGATGKVTVTIRTPAGVAANVRLAGPGSALFAKRSAGSAVSITRQLATGRYRVVPEAAVSGGVLYASGSHQSLTVVAGRSERITVRFAKVASASSLHVSSISASSISLAWSAPAGAGFALRRTTGSQPAASRHAGTAVPVNGRTATDTRLAPGKQYAYALFTRIDGHWAGPITLQAGTAAPKGSKTAAYAVVPGAVLATPGQVHGAVPTGTGVQVTLSPSVATPTIGSAVVLPQSASLPGGYVGQVSGISPNGGAVTLQPASLSDAFSYYHVDVPSFSSPAVALTPAAGRQVRGGRRGAAGPAAEAGCGGSSSGTVNFSPSLRLGGSFQATINTTSFLHVPEGASLSMKLTATVNGAMSVSTSASLSCDITFLNVFDTITLDPVPIAVSFSPGAEISVEGEVDESNLGATVTGGVQFSGTLGVRSGAHFSGSDILTAQPLTPEFSQTGSIGVKLGGQLIVGPGAGTTDAGVIAGLSGELDPVNASFGPVSAQDSSCLETSVGLLDQLGLTAKAWLGEWSIDRNITFSALTANLPYGGSPWYSPADCEDDQPLTADGGALPDGQVSVAYDQTLGASGGDPPYTWQITDGSLPPGITMDDTGDLTGTPVQQGTSQFTAEVTDSDDDTASATFTLTVDPVQTAPDQITGYTVSPDLDCDMTGSGDSDGEFYGDTACGTIIGVNGDLYGPADIPAGDNLTGASNYSAWDPISQTTTGDGTSASDPSVTTTDASADGSSITVSQTDSYYVGGDTVATTTTLANSSDAPVQVVLYHAFDCYTGDSDYGTGTSSDGSVSCVSGNVTSNGAPTLTLVPGSAPAASTYVEEFYADLWSDISTGNTFPDTVETDYHDTAEGLAWPVTVPANGSVSVSYQTQLLETLQ